MTDTEQLARIRDILRPKMGTEPCPHCSDGRWMNGRDGICRTCDNAGTIAVVDGLSVEDAVRRAVAERAAVAEMRERAAKEADLRGGMTQGDDYDRGWVRCALRVAAAIRALPLPLSNEEPKR